MTGNIKEIQIDINKKELEKFNIEAKTREILQSLKGDIIKIGEEYWNLTKDDLALWAKTLADFQYEKIFTPKTTTEMDEKYLLIVGKKSIEGIIEGRIEKTEEEAAEKIKTILSNVTNFAIDFAIRAAKVWLA